jgi:signal transduction histidine kinase
MVLRTDYAPAERASTEDVLQRSETLQKSGNFRVFDFVPDIFLIVDRHRQIVLSNQALKSAIGIDDFRSICGLRPGELLRCECAANAPNGCGTAEFCRECGALNAILDALSGKPSIRECIITRTDAAEPLELRIWATPVEESGERYAALFAKEISEERRLKIIERIFHHDILNTAGSMVSLTRLLDEMSPEEYHDARELVKTLHVASEFLLEEIQQQREIKAAVGGELELRPDLMSSADVIRRAADFFLRNPTIRKGPKICLDQIEEISFTTDFRLLLRVLVNMIKNAVEASNASETVTIRCRKIPHFVEITVHNPSVIPEENRRLIFRKSFSTKGEGRGLGTWSIRLLTETYLQGVAFFSSTKEAGTTFGVRIPISAA